MKFTPFILTAVTLLSSNAFADFGEIDILVRESIGEHFKDYGKSVDLKTLEYRGEPQIEGGVMTVQSSVWAEQHLTAPYWGWYGCTTELKVIGNGNYSDLGTDCIFDID